MQTFLPYPDFYKSALVLDNKRLGKQRIEAWQIYCALTQEKYGWKNHPAVLMWKGYEYILLRYGAAICEEWIKRGYKDNMWARFLNEFIPHRNKIDSPKWLGDEQFHASHRSNLLRKNPEHYKQFNWSEGPDLPYYWPVRKEETND